MKSILLGTPQRRMSSSSFFVIVGRSTMTPGGSRSALPELGLCSALALHNAV